jgi:hypothetical protein
VEAWCRNQDLEEKKTSKITVYGDLEALEVG